MKKDSDYRSALREMEALREKRNRAAEAIGRSKNSGNGGDLEALKRQAEAVKAAVKAKEASGRLSTLLSEEDRLGG